MEKPAMKLVEREHSMSDSMLDEQQNAHAESSPAVSEKAEEGSAIYTTGKIHR
jgi:hypothetical protein